jgi:hypothetical protein
MQLARDLQHVDCPDRPGALEYVLMAGARIPASPVSEAMSAWQEYARHFRNLPPDGRVSEPQFPGCVASNDQFSSTSLCSRILNVRVVIKETRFEVARDRFDVFCRRVSGMPLNCESCFGPPHLGERPLQLAFN